LALTGTFAVYAYVKHADKRALADAGTSQVLVVRAPIPAGTSWSDVTKGDYVKQETVPATAVPVDAIANVNDTTISGSEVATAVVEPGQLLLRPMFNDQAAVTGVLPIPKGMVAISISLSSTADVAGYVQPQSEVAIFVTAQLNGNAATNAAKQNSVGNANLSVTKLLLSNVRVIATSAAAPTDVTPHSGSSSGGTVLITLAVSQQDAQRIILAQQVGQLYLGLLSKDSNVSTNDGGVTNIGRIAPTPIFLK
jgi:pilus assembly protein CpaB